MKKELKTVFAAFEEKAKTAKVQTGLLAGGAMFAMSPVAFAAEGGGGTGAGGMSAVLGAFDTVTSLMNSVWELMTSNPLLTLFLAAGLLSIGVGAFRKIKSAAKGG